MVVALAKQEPRFIPRPTVAKFAGRLLQFFSCSRPQGVRRTGAHPLTAILVGGFRASPRPAAGKAFAKTRRQTMASRGPYYVIGTCNEEECGLK